MKGKNVLFSSKSDDWETPNGLYNSLNMVHHFTLDPCATSDNAKCEKFYTSENNGLAQDWTGETVFINPPFSQIAKWVEKAWVEMMINGVKSIMLLPSRTDTKWFHTYIYKVPNVNVDFIRGRLKFAGSDNSAPFPSMVVIFDPNLEILHVEYTKADADK